ncbi:MAG: hypothetical protein J6C85_05255 [Alphaproteobacteria bacterium]|nr:hypothetical protein [Alphaproteobacteria bacterium]
MNKKNFLICLSSAVAAAGVGALAWCKRDELKEKVDKALDRLTELPDDDDL